MSTLKKSVYEEVIGFIDENQNNLYRLAYSYMKSQEAALDMVQETIYKVIKNYNDVGEDSNVKSWIFKILVNTCLDELRKGKHTVTTAPEEMPEETDESLERRAEYMSLYEAMENLEIKTKTVIAMRYFEDMKLSEIAEMLGENLNSIKSRLYRGLQSLRIEMEEEVS